MILIFYLINIINFLIYFFMNVKNYYIVIKNSIIT